MTCHGIRRGVWLCLLLVFSTSATAADSSITIASASLRPGLSASTSNVWRLDANADIELNRVMRNGLDNGVPLHFIVQLEIRQPRRFWPDSVLLSHEQRYSVIYYELTRHYRVQTEMPAGLRDADDTRNFRSLLPALDGLGRVRGLPIELPADLALRVGEEGAVGDAAEVPALIAGLSIRLDGGALPLPLQPLVSSTWRLASKEFTWLFR